MILVYLKYFTEYLGIISLSTWGGFLYLLSFGNNSQIPFNARGPNT